MSLTIAGVKVTPITLIELHHYIASCIKINLRVPILHANVHAINLAQSDKEFRSILNNAPVVFCDGFGVRIGARILGYKLPPRITYADLIYQLAPFCVEQGFSLYLLGGQPGVAERASRKLVERFPDLKIVGTHHGYFNKDGVDNDELIAAINQAKPDILLVGFGMPLQERWIDENLADISTHVALSSGACLDYVAGEVRRGSPLLVNYGFEWLARMLIEPRRLWRRYVLGNPYFLFLILRQWLKQR